MRYNPIPLPPCPECGKTEVAMDESHIDFEGIVPYCESCGAFPEEGYATYSSARRGWRNFANRVNRLQKEVA